MDLEFHSKGLTEIAHEVVNVILIFQFQEFFLPVQRQAGNLQSVLPSCWLFVAQMEVTESVLLVYPEEAGPVPAGDHVAHVVFQGLDGRQEFHDVIMDSQVGDIHIQRDRCVDVQARQTNFVILMGSSAVGAPPVPASLGIAVDLTLVTGLGRQQILLRHLLLLFRQILAVPEAHSSYTVSLSRSVVAAWATTEVATVCVGAAIRAGVSRG